MAIVKVYDKDGAEHEREAVDARECVDVLGWSLEPKEEKPQKKTKKQDESQVEV